MIQRVVQYLKRRRTIPTREVFVVMEQDRPVVAYETDAQVRDDLERRHGRKARVHKVPIVRSGESRA